MPDRGPDWDEQARLAALEEYRILDTPPEPEFEDIVRLVADLFEAPIAVVNLIAGDRQWFKAETGLGVRETPLDVSICAHAILQPGLFVVPDTTTDERFRCNPLVTGEPRLRFYAGALLETPEGLPLGTLCVLDTKTRPDGITDRQRLALEVLARQVMTQLELRRAIDEREERSRLLEAEVARRRGLEGGLHASEDRYRQMVEGAEDFAIFTLDEHGVIGSWNRGAERILGYPAEEAVGRPGAEIFTGEDRAAGAPDDEMNRARAAGRAVDERWHVRRDGSRFWASGLLMRLAGGGYLKMFRDRTAEHSAEAALRESEARLRIVQAAGGVGSFDYDLEKDEAVCSPEYYALLGLPEGAPVNSRTWPALIHPEDREKAVEALNTAIESRKPFDHEYRIIRPDTGEVRWLAGRAAIICDEAGNPQRFVGGNIDVTARKAAEAELRESDARLRALTDHLPGGMVYQIATGPDGAARKFLYVSQSHEQLTGVPAEAVLADPSIPYNMIHPDDRPLLVEAEAEAIRTKAMFDAEVRFRRADGELRWCRLISAPREQPDGSLIWDGIQIDVTGRKAAEAAVRDSEARFQAIANSIDQMVWSARPDGYHDYFNRRWYEFTGMPEGSTDGEEWNGMFHPEDQDRAWSVWRHCLETGEPYHIEYRLRHRSGDFRWVLGRAQPVRDEQGAITRWFGTCTDIEDIVEARDVLARSREQLERMVEERTEALVQAQEQLRQSQKLEAMGQLTGGVAHDFNNLLTPIVGSLDLLQRRRLGGEREQRLIDGALQSAERAKTLVQRLLAFARRQPLQSGAVDVGNLVRGMAELVVSTSGPQVKVVVEVPDALPPATADQNQLEMAILNLSVNARDAMPDGGTLTISAAAETAGQGHRAKLKAGDYVRLSVADTGTGMDEETLARAVEPFFSTKGIGKGTGLGLSMVHGLASQLGGALAITSRPGLGTRIDLWLPVSEEPAEADEPAAVAAPGAKAIGTALLVDDEELVRMSTADMLSELGYRVVEAASGEEALKAVDGGLRPDLLVTDHLMPGMSGADLAREVRARRPGTLVLIVSGYAEAEAIAPDLPRLTKPFRQSDLAGSLAGLKGP
ncbi:MAG TPA: PAS domain-containing protein [Allosphingosinicella sp.]|jgi:PAS domain S-box-containing protein